MGGSAAVGAQLVLGDVAQNTGGHADQDGASRHILRHDGTGADERLFAHLDAGAEAHGAADPGAAALETPIVARGSMTGRVIEGPLIIESYDTTIVVPPGARASADAIGNLTIDIDS